MHYVLSTLAGGVDYTRYKKTKSGKHVAEETVSINGGGGVADKKTLITPLGVVTPVTDKQAALLKTIPLFKEHLEAGHVKILDTDPRDPDTPAGDMPEDASRQVTPLDYTVQGKEAPTTGGA